ncbi:hypothetical protein [Cystobacter fuscus]|uniref:hypothetical protein n=1 Tax=Cystobacter fuscus TaxID=43 RepID=UPI0037C061A6
MLSRSTCNSATRASDSAASRSNCSVRSTSEVMDRVAIQPPSPNTASVPMSSHLGRRVLRGTTSSSAVSSMGSFREKV